MTYINGLGAVPTPATSLVSAPSNPISHATIDTASASALGTDEANLSSASTLVAQALNTSDVRSEKVDSLQQAIASGSYQVPTAAVADSLLQSMLS